MRMLSKQGRDYTSTEPDWRIRKNLTAELRCHNQRATSLMTYSLTELREKANAARDVGPFLTNPDDALQKAAPETSDPGTQDKGKGSIVHSETIRLLLPL